MFSALKRQDFLHQLKSETFDLLVIGGGITGAGIALDAATRGLRVALIEKQDFAAGTSSRSTKLIHGGLRYLKQLEFGLVREVGREREIVFQNATHIVVPEKMLLPIVEGGSLSKIAASFGLYVYDWLAGVKKEERRKMLNKNETEKREPLLRKDILKGGALYIEYRSDDARLVIENLKTAHQKGAVCLNYMKAKDFIYQSGKAVGIKAKDIFTGKELNIKAKKIVNAAGPWVDELRQKDQSLRGKRLHLTKGVHLVFEHQQLPVRQALYFDVPEDKRMIFAIPRGNTTYVGTTDTNYHHQLERPRVTQSDVDYLLNAIHQIFEGIKLTEKDITSTWCGLRPLIHEEGKKPSELSRRDEIFYSGSGVITIAGGKLTGYRKMAERTVDVVMKQLEKEGQTKFVHCSTDRVALTGSNFSSREELMEFAERKVDEAGQVCNRPDKVKSLVHRYGTETEMIINKAYDLHNEGKNKTPLIDSAEVWYGIHHEMASTLSDFLIRRTGQLYFNRPALKELYPKILEEMCRWHNWDELQMEIHLKEFEKEYEQVLDFQDK